jgi:hypothetical protein
MKDKKLTKPILIVSGIVVGMILILFLSTSVIPQVLITLTKASNSGEVVTSNSYMIGEKILAKADGVDKCVVNVFLLDKDGKGSMGKSATLTGMNNIKAVGSGLSDNMGKITFEMTSAIEKTYSIQATSEGSPLPQTIIVTFKN